MKSLDDVEPRLPIYASDLPLTIGAPGSYYLAERVVFSGAGIDITSSDVSIDLRGFLLSAMVESSVTGLARVKVRNGSVGGFALGGVSAVTLQDIKVPSGGSGTFLGHRANVIRFVVDSGASVGLFCGDQCVVTDSQIVAPNTSVLSAGQGSILTNVVIEGRDLGIGDNSIVSKCVIRGYDFALSAGDRVEIVDSTFRSDGDGGVSVGLASRISGSYVSGGHYFGIEAGAGSSLDSLVVEAGDGIVLGDGSRLTGSIVSSGTADAVLVGSNSTVLDNTCKAEGSATTAGIRVTGSGNRIEGNLISGSGIGLKVMATGNLVVKNTAHANVTADFDIVPGNDVGPVGTASTSMSPWANVSF